MLLRKRHVQPLAAKKKNSITHMGRQRIACSASA